VISIIVCSITPAKYEAVCASYARALAGAAYEIVGIHDARSLCEGYNRGLRRAKGDVLVFSHDDIELLAPRLDAALSAHLRDADVVGVAGTTRQVGMGWTASGIEHAHGLVTHPAGSQFDLALYGVTAPLMLGIQSLDGVFFATRRDVAQALGFDEETFDGWHGYDADFTYRCYRANFRVAVALDIRLVHYSSANVDLAWLDYDARFRAKHGPAVCGPAGRWLDVKMRVSSLEDVAKAYDLQALRELTITARSRARSVLAA
jgi:GT2 family glycosyltransferase